MPDPTILDTSEVELVDVKFLEEEPIVVVQVGLTGHCSINTSAANCN